MKRIFSRFLAPILVCSSAASVMAEPSATTTASSPELSVVVDLTHGYSFYTGFGTFLGHYMKSGQNGVNNWRSFNKLDLKNANVFVLPACDEKVPYTDKDKSVMKQFVEDGGAVVILGAPNSTQQNAMAGEFGVQFAAAGKSPLSFTANSPVKGDIESEKAFTLTFTEPTEWVTLMADAEGKPVLAEKKQGKGKVLAASTTLAGSRKDKKDGSINDKWMNPLFVHLGAGKKVDLSQKVDGGGLVDTDNSRRQGSLVYHWSDYLDNSAQAMMKMDSRCRPTIQKYMGVPLSPGMSGEVGLLATGAGGYSNGKHIGLAVFWGGFPEREDSMIEFVTHENVHSWVLPHAEPYWNEPIATYVGDLVMGAEGHPEEAEKRIKNTIEQAKKIDPTMKIYNLDGKGSEGARVLDSGEARAINWGKSTWVFEEMRKIDPMFNAKYFQAKRKYVPAELPKRYSLDDAVAVMSIAAGKDLFPWFCEHGMPVDRKNVQFKVD